MTKKISELPALAGVPAGGDLFPLVDISDVTEAPTGTTKKVTYAELVPGMQPVIENTVITTTGSAVAIFDVLAGVPVLKSTAAMTDGQLPIGSSSGLPAAANITGTADEIDITNGSNSITIGIVNPLKVAKGGIGLATATAGDMLTYVSGTAYTAIPKGTANQILGMNNGATTQEYKTVTAGTGIGVTNGAGSITIAADAAVTRWVKYSKAHGDFSEAGLGVAETVTLAALPARTIVSSAVIKTVTAFSGGGLASLDASVGITGNTTAIIGTYDAFAAAGDNNFSGGAGSLYYAGTNLTLTLTPDGAANLAGMNAGSIEVWIETATLPA